MLFSINVPVSSLTTSRYLIYYIFLTADFKTSFRYDYDGGFVLNNLDADCIKQFVHPVLTCVINFITRTWSALNDLETLALSFFLEKASFKISSGADFQTDWITFKSHLAKNLALLNIESTLTKEI